jgi:hypothetical protein
MCGSKGETVWLTQAHMAELFQTTKQNLGQHLKNIFEEGELAQESVVKNFFTTAADGKNYSTNFYNLDAIISVGYRVKIPRRHPLPHLGHAEAAGIHRQGFRPRRRAPEKSRPAFRLFRGIDAADSGHPHVRAPVLPEDHRHLRHQH